MSIAGTLLVKGVDSMTKKESFTSPSPACTMKQGFGDSTFLAVPLTSAVPYSRNKWITYYDNISNNFIGIHYESPA